MNPILRPPDLALPDHSQLPATDGRTSDDFRLHPQGALLLDALQPVLKRLHPDGCYLIGVKVGIHWREGDELRGCSRPDWFYVPNVAPLPTGTSRRSYVLWKEHVRPQVILEYVSGDGSEERDSTPETGKFWVYEQAIQAAFYGIFDSEQDLLEMYQLAQARYRRMAPNAHGRYLLPPLGVELGLWHGEFETITAPWLRWWDTQGNLLLTGHETAAQERQAKEQAENRAEALASKLRALGVDPES